MIVNIVMESDYIGNIFLGDKFYGRVMTKIKKGNYKLGLRKAGSLNYIYENRFEFWHKGMIYILDTDYSYFYIDKDIEKSHNNILFDMNVYVKLYPILAKEISYGKVELILK